MRLWRIPPFGDYESLREKGPTGPNYQVTEAESSQFPLYPKNTRPKTLILGGLQPPDPTGVPEDKYRKLYSAFRKKRKAFTDKRHNKLAKVAQSAGGLA